ncbi:MAG: sirohydrochlorin chelatase [Ferrimicrobium sp.]
MADPTTHALFMMGHGSVSKTGRRQLLDLIELIRQRWQGPVTGGFIEFAEPEMYSEMDRLLASDPRKVTIVPVILLPAGHLKDDAAKLANYARKRRPDVAFTLASDLGTLGELIALARLRIQETAPTPNTSALLVVGRGASDPGANAELFAISRLIAETSATTLVDTSFISLATPSVPEGLDRLTRLGATSIIVSPYFLFHGTLLDRIRDQATHWSTSTGVAVTICGELGVHRLLVEALWLRIKEAGGQTLRTSCDLCIYRDPSLIRRSLPKPPDLG